jgi:hypothetical protein
VALDARLEGGVEAAERLSMPELAWRFLAARGDLHRRRSELDAAVREYAAAIERIESMRAGLVPGPLRLGFVTELRERVYADTIAVLAGPGGLGRPAEALEYAERARSRALVEQLALVLPRPPARAPAGLIDEERRLVELLRDRAAVGSGAEAGEHERLERDLGRVWAALEAVSPEYVAHRRAAPVSIAAIRDCLAS